MIGARVRKNDLGDGSFTYDVILTQNEGNSFHSAELEINCTDSAHADRLITELRLTNNISIKEVS